MKVHWEQFGRQGLSTSHQRCVMGLQQFKSYHNACAVLTHGLAACHLGTNSSTRTVPGKSWVESSMIMGTPARRLILLTLLRAALRGPGNFDRGWK